MIVLDRDNTLIRARTGYHVTPDNWVFMPNLPQGLQGLPETTVLLLTQQPRHTKKQQQFTERIFKPIFQEHCPWVNLEIKAVKSKLNHDIPADKVDFVVGDQLVDKRLADKLDAPYLHPFSLFDWKFVDLMLGFSGRDLDLLQEYYHEHQVINLQVFVENVRNILAGAPGPSSFIVPTVIHSENPRPYLEDIALISSWMPFVLRVKGDTELYNDLLELEAKFLWYIQEPPHKTSKEKG